MIFEQETGSGLKIQPQKVQNLKKGLDFVGKLYLNSAEWTGKFAQKQFNHQNEEEKESQTFFGNSISKTISKYHINLKNCGLCMLEKPRSEFVNLGKCEHDYCYSCLNSYAISKIEDLCVVVCPHQKCGELMSLASKVYKFLPDKIKMKYLKNKTVFNPPAEESKCQRCFESKHPGSCKYSLEPRLIDSSFTFRQCSTCQKQIYMTEGKKKVVCKKCKNTMCYLCGKKWKQADNIKHVCGLRGQILELEKQFRDSKCCGCQECCFNCQCECCDCCDVSSCDLECDCCIKCDSYDLFCDILFHCSNLSALCVVWNVLSIPFRILLSILVISIMVLAFSIRFIAAFMAWIILGLIVGFLSFPCMVMSTVGFPIAILVLIFFPITVLIGFFYALIEHREVFLMQTSEFAKMTGNGLAFVWIDLSPYKCLTE